MSLSRQRKYCFRCRKDQWHEPTPDGGWVCSKCQAIRPKPIGQAKGDKHEKQNQPQGG